MTTTGKTSRYGFIDAIRGIAACSVMFQHSLYASGLLISATNDQLTGFIPRMLELGETGVVAFFLVSGFVIPLTLDKTHSVKLFWLHRALRIYPLYILIFFATFAVHAGGDIRSVKEFLVNFLSHLFFVQEYAKQEEFVGGSWTLSLEVVWYSAISCLFLLSLDKKTTLLVWLSVLVSMLVDSVCAFGHHLPTGRLSMLLCCVLGLVCYRHSKDELSIKTFLLFAAILTATIIVNLLAGLRLFPSSHPTSTFQSSIDSWAIAAAIFFIPFATRKSTIWAHPAGAFLGRISYSIYLLHPILLYVILQTPIRGLLLMVITFACTIALAILTYKYVEAPAIRFGHSRKASAIIV